MKNWVRVLALSLALVMVLGVSAAFADAYTIPKTLKNVEGLPENPEVPELKTINDGKTETVTVVSGQLVSLSAVWGDATVPLTLADGAVSFDMTGHNVQLGMKGKSAWYHYDTELTTKKKLDNPYYDYDVTKNDDGTFSVKENYVTEGSVWYSGSSADEKLDYPKDSVTEKRTFQGIYNRDYYITAYKEPYVAVTNPGYEVYIPTSGLHTYTWYDVDPDTRDENGKAIIFDANGNYIIKEYTSESPYQDYTHIDSSVENASLAKDLQAKVDEAVAKYGEDVQSWAWFWFDSDGSVVAMYHIDQFESWAEDIDGYGKAFEGKTADGWTVGYNRKGAACEKSIEMTGVDFFQSETAPSKVTVSWQSGKNMYNKTVWYISKISQEYANEIVTASFAQGGQWNGIKKEAKAAQ